MVPLDRCGNRDLETLSNLPGITQPENEDLKPSVSESRAWYFIYLSLVLASTQALDLLFPLFSFLSASVSLFFLLSPITHLLPPVFIYEQLFSRSSRAHGSEKFHCETDWPAPDLKAKRDAWYPSHRATAWGHCWGHCQPPCTTQPQRLHQTSSCLHSWSLGLENHNYSF